MGHSFHLPGPVLLVSEYDPSGAEVVGTEPILRPELRRVSPRSDEKMSVCRGGLQLKVKLPGGAVRVGYLQQRRGQSD